MRSIYLQNEKKRVSSKKEYKMRKYEESYMSNEMMMRKDFYREFIIVLFFDD